MIDFLFRLPRAQKRVVSVLADIVFLSLSLIAALFLRLDQLSWSILNQSSLLAFSLTLIATIVLFIRIGLYRAVIRYMSNHALYVLLIGTSVSALLLATFSFLLHAPMPRSTPLIYWCLAIVFVGGSRLIVRSTFQHQMMKAKERVIIYGAGHSGIQLSSSLYQGNQFQPVIFVDDDPKKQGTIINGLRVYPAGQLAKAIERYGASRILLALGNSSRLERSQILQLLEPMPIKVQTIPAFKDVVSGRASITEVRDIEIEDLLCREEMTPDQGLLGKCITDKVVMVTGAGGSIGSELCRQIIELQPRTLVLIELSEYGLYKIAHELETTISKLNYQIELKPILGSVQKEHRMQVIMQSFGVNTLYHAAAYKHVPMVEHNMIEGIRNNIFGTWYAAEAAVRAGVETFVLVSTDKAVRPTNIMGASKRMAELVLQGLAQRTTSTHFCMVRFGNVLGSSGSVVPLFREQILKGGPVTVTHPDIRRFFMTIPEAALLVLQAGAMGSKGDVFVLDMGDSIKIDTLARRMVHLMGCSIRDAQNLRGDIEIVYTGLRPGEKLYEELLIGNNAEGTAHPCIFKAREEALTWEQVESLLTSLDRACHTFDCESVREILLSSATGFSPSNEIEDLVWQETKLAKSVVSNVEDLKKAKIEKQTVPV